MLQENKIMSFDIKLLQYVHCLFSIIFRILLRASAKALRDFSCAAVEYCLPYHVHVTDTTLNINECK